MSDEPHDPFEPEFPPGFENLEKDQQKFIRMLARSEDTIKALKDQSDFAALMRAILALRETEARAALARLLVDTKRVELGPAFAAWFKP